MAWSTIMTNIQWAERTHAGESSNSLVTPALSLPPILYGKPKHREAKQLARGCGWYVTEPEFKPDRLASEATSLTLHHTESFLEEEGTWALPEDNPQVTVTQAGASTKRTVQVQTRNVWNDSEFLHISDFNNIHSLTGPLAQENHKSRHLLFQEPGELYGGSYYDWLACFIPLLLDGHLAPCNIQVNKQFTAPKALG